MKKHELKKKFLAMSRVERAAEINHLKCSIKSSSSELEKLEELKVRYHRVIYDLTYHRAQVKFYKGVAKLFEKEFRLITS